MSARRSLYVFKNIKKGEKFTINNVRSVGPGPSLHSKYLKNILEKKFLNKNNNLLIK